MNLVAVIVLLGGGVMATTFVGRQRAMRTLSYFIISRTIDQTELGLRHLFDPISQELVLARAWGEAGLLAPDNIDGLNQLAMPLIEQRMLISSAILADETGHEYMLLYSDGKWISRITRADEWGPRTRWTEWTAEDPEPIVRWKDIDYDPRRRPWYQGAIAKYHSSKVTTQPAVAASQVYWTRPYRFFTTRELGITASIAFEHPNGRKHVLALDVLLKDISQVTMNMEVGQHGMVAVLSDERKVIGLPRDARFASDKAIQAALLKTPIELGATVLSDAAETHRKNAVPTANRPVGFPFTSQGRKWWARAKPFRVSEDREWRIVVLVPEADLLGDITQLRVFIAMVILTVLAGAFVRAVVLARRYSQPLEELARNSDRIREGDLEPGIPIRSPIREVGRLAKAQERMRTALRSLMKLERDLQLARQIQQNTFPEKLPELPGFDIAAYSDPAEETGGDSYDIIGYRGTLISEPIQLRTEGADHAVLLLGDATGHGIGPALSSMQIRAMLRMAVRSGEPLGRIAVYLNEQLYADLRSDRFITAWLGVLDATEHTLISFSAGQAPLIRYDAAEDAFDVLNADAPPFGVIEEMDVKLNGPIAMQPGDIFAVISDGIFEAANDAGERFGVQRTTDVIREHRQDNTGEILQALRQALADYTHKAPAEDDRTAIIIKRT